MSATGATDAARARRIAALLTTRTYGRSMQVLSETGSTNDDARRAAAAGEVDGHVIVADTQAAGRGSGGRSWSSPAGSDIYLSIIDRPAVALHQLPPLTLAVGLGVADAVQHQLAELGRNTVAEVKWPNDVWIDGRKCAGILIEATTTGSTLQAVVIGIGLNVNRTTFAPELADLATSLRGTDPGSAPLDRDAVLAALLEHVEERVRQFTELGAEPIAAQVDARLAMRGQTVICGDVRGTLRGVAPSGAVRIETDTGIREVVTGRLMPSG